MDDLDTEVYEVWRENQTALDLFDLMETQWAVTDGAVIGLRYEALYPLLERLERQGEDFETLFADIRVMEQAAMQQMKINKR